MHRVYICSPLGGNVSANIENAKRYARYALECGMAPFIPHFYALILNDDDEEEIEIDDFEEEEESEVEDNTTDVEEPLEDEDLDLDDDEDMEDLAIVDEEEIDI